MTEYNRLVVTAFACIGVALASIGTAMYTTSRYAERVEEVRELRASLRESEAVIAHLKEVKIRTATRMAAAR